ncbi:MAG: EVE domain-containing protein [Pseudomonadota bacterium]
MNYWLMKSEPEAYSIDDLMNEPENFTAWDGVRNYQARNMLRDAVKAGDLAFFYHSNCNEPGIMGIMKVVKSAYPDFTAFDKKSPNYDPKSDAANPRWYVVDVQFVRKLKRNITLKEIKQSKQLSALQLVKKGNRLSVMPVTDSQWRSILDLE